METLKKLNKAIELIKSKNLKKKGKNTFSKYDYYTPDQVAELVTWACHEVKLLPKFDLIRDELGITGRLSVYDIESDNEPVVYEMASAIPEIKATNISQQLGGAMTYTKRYLLMNAFDIVDNNLDFDTTENTKASAKPVQKAETSVDPLVVKSITSAITKCEKLSELQQIWKNNEKMQKEQFFVKLVNARKQLLTQNGITE